MKKMIVAERDLKALGWSSLLETCACNSLIQEIEDLIINQNGQPYLGKVTHPTPHLFIKPNIFAIFIYSCKFAIAIWAQKSPDHRIPGFLLSSI